MRCAAALVFLHSRICQTPITRFPARVIWLLLIPAALIGYILWAGRRHVCIRRKDCCGKGCGCLFPVKLKDE